VHPGADITWHSRRVAASRLGRHFGLLAGLLLVAVGIGTAYRYLFDPVEKCELAEQSPQLRSRDRLDGRRTSEPDRGAAIALGGGLRRLPLVAEFPIKALLMTAVLTIVAVGLQLVLYPDPFPRPG
jgi:hypothetical protein